MALDTSRMNVPDKLPNELEMLFRNAFQQMQELEKEVSQILMKTAWLVITG